MLPNEYEPLVLTPRQQEVHRRYTAMGFKICPRPFAGKGDHLWFFMSLPTPENQRGIEFTINLHSGIAHRTGTQTVFEMDAAEKEFGGATIGERSGVRSGVSPPSEVAAPIAAAKPEQLKAVKAEPAKPLGGLTPPRSPEKSAPVKKKQTALF